MASEQWDAWIEEGAVNTRVFSVLLIPNGAWLSVWERLRTAVGLKTAEQDYIHQHDGKPVIVFGEVALKPEFPLPPDWRQ